MIFCGRYFLLFLIPQNSKINFSSLATISIFRISLHLSGAVFFSTSFDSIFLLKNSITIVSLLDNIEMICYNMNIKNADICAFSNKSYYENDNYNLIFLTSLTDIFGETTSWEILTYTMLRRLKTTSFIPSSLTLQRN